MASIGTIPPFARGAFDVGTMTIQGVSVVASGVATTTGAASVVYAYLATLSLKQTNKTDDISAVTSPVDNNMKLSAGTAISVKCKMLRTGSAVLNSPRTIAQTFDYVQLIYQMNGTWTYTGLIENYEESLETKGEITCSFDLIMADIGSANPLLS